MNFAVSVNMAKAMYFPFLFLNQNYFTFRIIHSDIWGASPIPRSAGYKYYIHFIDDFTCFTWIYALKHKLHVIVALNNSNFLWKSHWTCLYDVFKLIGEVSFIHFLFSFHKTKFNFVIQVLMSINKMVKPKGNIIALLNSG